MIIFQIPVLIFLISYAVLSLASGHPIVAVDPGHEPSKSGAQGTCGKSEVIYNDLMARILKDTLTPSYSVLLTRQPTEEVKVTDDLLKEVLGVTKGQWARNKALMARPAIANAKAADVFISIHHDSVSKRHQTKQSDLCNGKAGVTVLNEFKKIYKIGFNIFVNNKAKEPNKGKSIRLAKLIGKAMIAMGRTPSDYHFYPIDDCKSCEPVDRELGVWHHDLAVLSHAKMPSVLIEIGNIVDHEDENRVNNDSFRTEFSSSLKSALDEYFASK